MTVTKINWCDRSHDSYYCAMNHLITTTISVVATAVYYYYYLNSRTVLFLLFFILYCLLVYSRENGVKGMKDWLSSVVITTSTRSSIMRLKSRVSKEKGSLGGRESRVDCSLSISHVRVLFLSRSVLLSPFISFVIAAVIGLAGVVEGLIPFVSTAPFLSAIASFALLSVIDPYRFIIVFTALSHGVVVVVVCLRIANSMIRLCLPKLKSEKLEMSHSRISMS